MFTAAGQAGEKCASGLNSILGITREPDHRVLNAFRPQIGSVGVRPDRLCSIIRSFTHGIRNVTDRNTISTVNSLEVAPRLMDSTRHGLAAVCQAVVP